MESVVPVIDFEVFKLGTSVDVTEPTEEVRTLAQDIVHALQTIGFIYLKNHGVSESLVCIYWSKLYC